MAGKEPGQAEGLSGKGKGRASKTACRLDSEELIRRTAELFGVLSDPTRIKIIHALSRAELCVGELAELAGVSDSAVSHQLRILRNLGLVSFRRDGKKALYSLSDEHLKRILEQSMEHVKER